MIGKCNWMMSVKQIGCVFFFICSVRTKTIIVCFPLKIYCCSVGKGVLQQQQQHKNQLNWLMFISFLFLSIYISGINWAKKIVATYRFNYILANVKKWFAINRNFRAHIFNSCERTEFSLNVIKQPVICLAVYRFDSLH